MSEQENVNSNQDVTNNQYYTSATALQIRLNVEPLLVKLEMDLRGLEEEWNEDAQTVVYVKKDGVTPLLNDLGIKRFLSFVRSVVNVQIVQGNLNEDTFADYLYNVHVSIAEDLMVNRYKYGLSLDDYNGVVNMGLITVEGFLTRTLGNKERESYANTLKHIESSQTVAQRGGGLFKF